MYVAIARKCFWDIALVTELRTKKYQNQYSRWAGLEVEEKEVLVWSVFFFLLLSIHPFPSSRLP